MIPVKNTGRIGLFTTDGTFHVVKCQDLPFGRLRDKGTPIDNISNFDSSKENYILVDSLEHIIHSKLLFMTKNAMAKMVDGSEFDVLKRTVAATKLSDGDELLLLKPVTDETRQILLQTEHGFFLRFNLDEIPEKKKIAVGVRCMKLEKDDSLEEAYLMNYADERTIEYKGQQMPMTYVKTAHRDTKGTKIRV